eukprot:Nk52_evm31s270 gene=Nk52_evmTU31s270
MVEVCNNTMNTPVKVCVTGAAGQIAYSLLYNIARGDIFGPEQPVILHLLDIPQMVGVLEGVVMELEDCALPLLKEVKCTGDPMEGFADVDAAVLVGAMPRKEGMERADLLKANANIFKVQGAALDKVAKKTVKVLVVGNPANTNAMICSTCAPSIPKENFSALTRLDHNRAKSKIAIRLGVTAAEVQHVAIWGNHSSTQYPDVSHAMLEDKKVTELVNDQTYLEGEFVKTIQTRGAAVIKARKLSSAMSAAKAIVDHMRDWWNGTPKGEWVSMAVPSDGSYGIKEGIIYSFPVTVSAKGKYTIVPNLKISDFSRKMMDATAKELFAERAEALAQLGL